MVTITLLNKWFKYSSSVAIKFACCLVFLSLSYLLLVCLVLPPLFVRFCFCLHVRNGRPAEWAISSAINELAVFGWFGSRNVESCCMCCLFCFGVAWAVCLLLGLTIQLFGQAGGLDCSLWLVFCWALFLCLFVRFVRWLVSPVGRALAQDWGHPQGAEFAHSSQCTME